jgi:hypothetical protein
MKSMLQWTAAAAVGFLIGIIWCEFNASSTVAPSSIESPAASSARSVSSVVTTSRALEAESPTPQPTQETNMQPQQPIEPESVQRPIDAVETRDDAMLHEIDALGGTPFDHEITSPGIGD